MAEQELAAGWSVAAATRAMVRSLGGTKITLCLCGGGETSSTVGIGLNAPSMESVEVSPVLLRTKSDGSREVVVDAQTLEAAVGASGEGMCELLRRARVNLGELEARVHAVNFDHLGGAAYLYRLKLEE